MYVIALLPLLEISLFVTETTCRACDTASPPNIFASKFLKMSLCLQLLSVTCNVWFY